MVTSALLLTVLAAAPALPPPPPPSESPGNPQPIAYVGVDVLPMDREHVLRNYTVIVKGDRIVRVGPADQVQVPAQARQIDGRGRYLMPGLAEMHGHLPNPNAPGASPELTETVLFLYLANGVTAVRGMQGNPAALELRDRIARGEVLGPRLWVAGQPLSGNSVRTAADGRRLVEAQKEAGFDLIKIHEGLKQGVYDTIAATARRVGIPFAGHVPDDVGVFHALEAGQLTIDHLDNYVEAAGGESVEAAGIERVVQATRRAGAWVVPTMALWETFLAGDLAALGDLPELRYVPAQWANNWSQQLGSIRRDNPDVSRAMREIALRRRVLKALSDAGAGILLGTDSPQIFSVPGFSMHREIRSMLAAGMTPYAILESGTRRVAEYFGAEREFGTIAEGRRADLVLLSGNPLETLDHLARPAGVMVGGRWIAADELARRLDEIAQRYRR